MKNRINQFLNYELTNAHEHESMWLLYLLTTMELSIDVENIRRAVQTHNDLLIIMSIDYIQNNYGNIYKEKKDYFKTLDEAITFFKSEIDLVSSILKDEDFIGTHWLLAYEVAYKNLRLNNNIKIYNARSKAFYKILEKQGISFYKK